MLAVELPGLLRLQHHARWGYCLAWCRLISCRNCNFGRTVNVCTLRLPVFEKPAKWMQVNIGSQLAHTAIDSRSWLAYAPPSGTIRLEFVVELFLFWNWFVLCLFIRSSYKNVQAIIYCPDRKDKQKKSRPPTKKKDFYSRSRPFYFLVPKVLTFTSCCCS